MAVGKRASPGKDSGVAKKQKTTAAGCAKVSETLASKHWIPSGGKDNFLVTVTSSLGVPKPERHAHQVALVTMIGDGLEAERNAYEAKVSAAHGPVAGAEDEKRQREDELQQATKAHYQQLNIVQEKKNKVNEATEAIRAAQNSLAEKEKIENAGKKMMESLLETKHKLEVVQCCLSLANEQKINGNSPAVKIPKEFVSIGRDLGLEIAMLNALPATLAKDPQQRSEFERFTIDSFVRSVSKMQEVYGEAAEAKQQQSNDERHQEVKGALAELERANQNKETCQRELKEAQDASHAGKKLQDEKQKHLNNYHKDMKVIMDASDKAKADLEKFMTGAWASFNELRDMEA